MDSNITDTAGRPYDVVEDLRSAFLSPPGRVYIFALAAQFPILVAQVFASAGPGGRIEVAAANIDNFFLLYSPVVIVFSYLYLSRNSHRRFRLTFPLTGLFLYDLAYAVVFALAYDAYSGLHHFHHAPYYATIIFFIMFVSGTILVLLTNLTVTGLGRLEPGHARDLALLSAVVCAAVLVTIHATGRMAGLEGRDRFVVAFVMANFILVPGVIAVVYRWQVRAAGTGRPRMRDTAPLAVLMCIAAVCSLYSVGLPMADVTEDFIAAALALMSLTAPLFGLVLNLTGYIAARWYA